MNEVKDPTRLDANESAFFKRQLEYIKRQTFDVLFKELKAFQLLPISNEAPQGADQITWRQFEKIGFAKIVADYANDFPRADVISRENTVKVYDVGVSYGYSIREIRRSQMAGTRLDQRRAESARRSSDQKMNSIAWNGDSDYNIQGFIDAAGITEYTVPTGVSGIPWNVKTPDEIIADMNGIVTAIIDSTNGVEAPDTMLMPIAQFELIATTRMTGDSDKTILGFFLENSRHIKTVDWLTELKGAGAGGADRFMVYERSDMKLTWEIPSPFEQFPAQQKGLEWEVPTLQSTAGILVYYPLSIAYGDGI